MYTEAYLKRHTYIICYQYESDKELSQIHTTLQGRIWSKNNRSNASGVIF